MSGLTPEELSTHANNFQIDDDPIRPSIRFDINPETLMFYTEGEMGPQIQVIDTGNGVLDNRAPKPTELGTFIQVAQHIAPEHDLTEDLRLTEIDLLAGIRNTAEDLIQETQETLTFFESTP